MTALTSYEVADWPTAWTNPTAGFAVFGVDNTYTYSSAHITLADAAAGGLVYPDSLIFLATIPATMRSAVGTTAVVSGPLFTAIVRSGGGTVTQLLVCRADDLGDPTQITIAAQIDLPTPVGIIEGSEVSVTWSPNTVWDVSGPTVFVPTVTASSSITQYTLDNWPSLLGWDNPAETFQLIGLDASYNYSDAHLTLADIEAAIGTPAVILFASSITGRAISGNNATAQPINITVADYNGNPGGSVAQWVVIHVDASADPALSRVLAHRLVDPTLVSSATPLTAAWDANVVWNIDVPEFYAPTISVAVGANGLTAYTLAEWEGDGLGWGDPTVFIGVIGATADYVYDPAQTDLAAANTAGLAAATVFGAFLQPTDRTIDGTIADAADLTGITLVSVTPGNIVNPGTVTQLIMYRVVPGGGPLIGIFPVADAIVDGTSEVSVLWAGGQAFDVSVPTVIPPTVQVSAPSTGGLTNYTIINGVDGIHWADPTYSFLAYIVNADMVWSPDWYTAQDWLTGDPGIESQLVALVEFDGRTTDGTKALSASNLNFVVGGVAAQYVIFSVPPGATDAVDYALIGHGTLIAPVDTTGAISLILTWPSQIVFDTAVPAMYSPTFELVLPVAGNGITPWAAANWGVHNAGWTDPTMDVRVYALDSSFAFNPDTMVTVADCTGLAPATVATVDMPFDTGGRQAGIVAVYFFPSPLGYLPMTVAHAGTITQTLVSIGPTGGDLSTYHVYCVQAVSGGSVLVDTNGSTLLSQGNVADFSIPEAIALFVEYIAPPSASIVTPYALSNPDSVVGWGQPGVQFSLYALDDTYRWDESQVTFSDATAHGLAAASVAAFHFPDGGPYVWRRQAPSILGGYSAVLVPYRGFGSGYVMAVSEDGTTTYRAGAISQVMVVQNGGDHIISIAVLDTPVDVPEGYAISAEWPNGIPVYQTADTGDAFIPIIEVTPPANQTVSGYLPSFQSEPSSEGVQRAVEQTAIVVGIAGGTPSAGFTETLANTLITLAGSGYTEVFRATIPSNAGKFTTLDDTRVMFPDITIPNVIPTASGTVTRLLIAFHDTASPGSLDDFYYVAADVPLTPMAVSPATTLTIRWPTGEVLNLAAPYAFQPTLSGAAATVAVALTPQPTASGSTVTGHVTITGAAGAPTGTVDIITSPTPPTVDTSGVHFTGAVIMGSLTLTPAGPNTSTASGTYIPLSPGTRQVYAVYGGDGTYGLSVSTEVDWVVIDPSTSGGGALTDYTIANWPFADWLDSSAHYTMYGATSAFVWNRSTETNLAQMDAAGFESAVLFKVLSTGSSRTESGAQAFSQFPLFTGALGGDGVSIISAGGTATQLFLFDSTGRLIGRFALSTGFVVHRSDHLTLAFATNQLFNADTPIAYQGSLTAESGSGGPVQMTITPASPSSVTLAIGIASEAIALNAGAASLVLTGTVPSDATPGSEATLDLRFESASLGAPVDVVFTSTIPTPVGSGPGSSVCCDVNGMILTINGQSLNTPAWNIDDLWALVENPAYRSGSVHIPGVDGRTWFGSRPDLTTVTLDLFISGDVNAAGTANADDELGMWTNLLTLRRHVTGAVTTGDGTVPATLQTADGVIHTANIRVWPLRLNRKIEIVRMGDGVRRRCTHATLKLDVPAGSFV